MPKNIYIEIYDDTDKPGGEWVKGHVDEATFFKAIDQQGFTRRDMGKLTHTYARYIPTRDRPYDMKFFVGVDKKPGAFKVTGAYYV